MARYIDADALLKAIVDEYGRNSATEILVLGVLNNLPTADVAEVKHGRWIRSGNEKRCSVCEFVYYSNNDDWNGCPNCLSKMNVK